jgi:predicted HTH domain antitoxin
MKLSLVVPCYNEEEILIESTEKLRKLLISLMEKEKISLPEALLYFMIFTLSSLGYHI